MKINLKGFVPLQRNATHDSTMARVIANSDVLEAAIVPHRHIATFPTVPTGQMWLTDLTVKIVQNRLRLGLRHPLDTWSEHRVYEQCLSPRLRVSAHHRVHTLGLKFLRFHVFHFRFWILEGSSTYSCGVESNTCRMYSLQSIQNVLHLWRQIFVGPISARKHCVVSDRRHFHSVKDRSQAWLRHVRIVRMPRFTEVGGGSCLAYDF
mmetsp:Transcript_1103/g.2530  ORF Transcript_1103/g.2530 Transcript_1103/m.2530 type:complete len:207 (+) Transcript_1103:271-891(+)